MILFYEVAVSVLGLLYSGPFICPCVCNVQSDLILLLAPMRFAISKLIPTEKQEHFVQEKPESRFFSRLVEVSDSFPEVIPQLINWTQKIRLLTLKSQTSEQPENEIQIKIER